MPAGAGYPMPLPGAVYPVQPPDPVPPPAAPAPMLRKPSAPPPPMLRDSSEFQTIVSGTNPLDRLYKASKQKEQNIPLQDNVYSKKHGYHPTQGNLLEGIDNWSGAAYKNQNSLTTVLVSFFKNFN